jgi:hypothetical protein
MEVLQEFKQAIKIESEKNAEEFASLMALPQNERIAKGVTMANFTLTFDFRDLPPSPWNEPINYPLSYINSVHVKCDKNITKFKEGLKRPSTQWKLYKFCYYYYYKHGIPLT